MGQTEVDEARVYASSRLDMINVSMHTQCPPSNQWFSQNMHRAIPAARPSR